MPEATPFVGLAHLALFTPDLEESLRFYTQVLPFKVVGRFVQDDPTGKLHAHDPGMDPLKYAMIQLGDIYIEVMERADKAYGNGVRGAIDHFGIQVQDLDAAIEYMRSRGWPEDKLPVPKTNSILNPAKPFRACAFSGPFGERIGLYEYSNDWFFKD